MAAPNQIDPELAQFVGAIQAGWGAFPDLGQRPFAEQRAAAEVVRARWRDGGPVMAASRDLTIDHGDSDSIRARLHLPATTPAALPVLVYLHGGGFTTFSIDTHDRVMREFAARAGVAVLGVDYALSPDVKFPVALDQIVAVIDWLAVHGTAQGLNPDRIAVGGDSAGGNLALATCLRLRDRGDGDRIAALLCAYGFFDDDFATDSHRLHGGDDKILTTAELGQYFDNYLGGTPHRDDPLALPARADFHDLPSSFHIIAECDPLADNDRAVAARMAAAGCSVCAVTYSGAVHSFLEAVSISSIADRALAESSAWLKATLRGGLDPS